MSHFLLRNENCFTCMCPDKWGPDKWDSTVYFNTWCPMITPTRCIGNMIFSVCVRFYQEGLKTLNHFQPFIENVNGELMKIKQIQNKERAELIELRDSLKGTLATYKDVRFLSRSCTWSTLVDCIQPWFCLFLPCDKVQLKSKGN